MMHNTPAPAGDDEGLPTPVLLSRGVGGYELYGYTKAQMRAAVAAKGAELSKMRTVMVAAAEEIAAHWDAHCDAEGYGPQNLMRRLEEGIPSEYGYTAGRFAELQAELSALREQLAEAVEANNMKDLQIAALREQLAVAVRLLREAVSFQSAPSEG